MSSKEDEFSPRVNDTIINMVTILKPQLSHRPFNFDTPLKRSSSSISSTSTDDHMLDMTPLKKFKQDPSSKDAFYVGSPREIRRIRADLVDARNTIISLETRITHMHTVRKEMQIMFDREASGLKSRQQKDRKTIETLEVQLQTIRKRELLMKENLQEVKKQMSSIKEETDVRIQELEADVSNLSAEKKLIDFDEHNESVSLTRRNAELELLYQAAQEETDAHKKLVEELNKKLMEKLNGENELEIKSQALNKALLQIKEFEYTKERYAEFQQQAKSQHHKISTYADLEKENQRLKDETKKLRNEVHNKLWLEEEVHNLKGRLVNFKEVERKYTELHVVNSQTENSLEEFRTLARSICETSSTDSALPRLLRTIVERLQQQEINLTSEKIKLESEMTTYAHESKVARDELEKSQKLIFDLQKSVKHHQSLIHRLQKKLSLVSGERDSYRKQLDSYERDLTICMNPSSTANPGAAQLQTQQERIASLNKMVNEYRDMVHRLETDLQNVEPGLQVDVIPIRAEQTARLQEDIEKLKNDNNLLRGRNDQLEIQLEEFLVGRDSLRGGRVVHAANNPLSEVLSQRSNDKEKLEEEVDKLKRKIRKMEEGLEASKLGDVTIDAKEVQSLKEQLRQSEVSTQRLKEYVKTSTQEFRNCVYMLMGYKIDKTSNSIKLTSMYAEKAEDYLCFNLNGAGALDLLETEFSAALEDMVELHLRHQRSIPVFLSALTMDLYNNRSMKPYDVDDDESEDD